jgi:hypothetical protein
MDYVPAMGDFSGAITTNMIRPDGHVHGLTLTATGKLTVRNYVPDSNHLDANGNPQALPVVVQNRLTMDSTSTLQIVFDSDNWGSIISFATGIPVSRGGMLNLTFADGVNLSLQIGRTFNVFDWTGVNPTGVFNVTSSYVWDLSKLYTAGQVTFAAASGLPGDFNNDGVVNSADYVVWRKGLGGTYPLSAFNIWRTNFAAASRLPGDFNIDGTVNSADYVVWRKRLGAGSTSLDYNTWRANFGARLGAGAALQAVESSTTVPEPSALGVLAVAAIGLLGFRQ